MTRWGGRRAQRARTYVLARDQGICHLCGHPGANSLDHLESRVLRPDLEWEPTNWRAAHLNRAGIRGGCTHPGCHCIGNRLRSAGSTTSTTTSPAPTRQW